MVLVSWAYCTSFGMIERQAQMQVIISILARVSGVATSCMHWCYEKGLRKHFTGAKEL